MIDRTDEITLSATRQEYKGALRLTGAMEGNKNAGVQIEVTGPDGDRIFGPQYIATNNQGSFSTEVQITRAGEYDVSFTDAQGYVGTKSITVTGSDAFEVSQTVTLPGTTIVSRPSAHARSSRESPAYFEVKTGTTSVNVYTSSKVDWVMEYIDDQGVLHTVNDHGELNPEEIAVQGKSRSIFFKIYPYKYSDSGEVFLHAENAQSVKVSSTIPAAFGSVAVSTKPTDGTQAPLHPAAAYLALIVAALFLRSRS